jgi:hypothetical protein
VGCDELLHHGDQRTPVGIGIRQGEDQLRILQFGQRGEQLGHLIFRSRRFQRHGVEGHKQTLGAQRKVQRRFQLGALEQR